MHNRSLYKKGVSLVTVLIFMMVATIAATATYKWLSSVGFTSADRMAIAEAKESSRAGIEAVRSWMTYHANDVGGIVRQYFDGKKKPVALDSVIHSPVSDKQHFSVWLTGVDASTSTYKFTIVSTGYSRADVKYSETSVLNVRGLYKVKEPVKFIHKPMDFHYSYFGGSTGGTDGVHSTSLLINGNWYGNPGTVDSNFIVTGNAELTGDSIVFGVNTCVGGNLTIMNGGVDGTDFYVHGDAIDLKGSISGNAYFNDDVSFSNTGDELGLEVDGDFTAKKSVTLNSNRNYKFDGNFCMGASGNLIATGFGKNFAATKNVCLEGSITGTNENNVYTNVKLGNSGFVSYVKSSAACEGSTADYCISNNKSFVSYAEHIEDTSHCIRCDTSVVDYCKGVLGTGGSGCDGSSFKIDDMLTTAYSSFSHRSMTSCLKALGSSTDDMTEISSCYTKAKEANELFHGFLVVNLDSISVFGNPTGELDGNFIFYADAAQNKELKFPPTSEHSNVFVYLGEGAAGINTTNADGERNYFFYSKANIGNLMNAAPNLTWSGSFYLTAESCARIEAMQSAKQVLAYNDKLVQFLLDSTIICDISEEGSCGFTSNSGSGSTSTAGEDFVEGYDIYYVATAPQLSISLESRRKNNHVSFENLAPNEYTTIKPSIVVMPRIAYLSQTPTGKLSDYYSVINLNKAAEVRNPSNVNCSPSLHTTTALVSPGEELDPDIYVCHYNSTTYGDFHFWVVVDGDIGGVSAVHFVEPYTQIFAGSSSPWYVSLVVDDKQSKDVTVTIKVDDVPTGWELKPVNGITSIGGGLYKVTVPAKKTTNIFEVTTQANAESGTQMKFMIDKFDGNNARLASPSVQTLYLSGNGRIVREDIPSAGLCDSIVSTDGLTKIACSDIHDLVDCSGMMLAGITGEWVRPNCGEDNAITTISPNNVWECAFGGSDGVKLVPGANLSPNCDLFIYDSTIVNPQNGYNYTLFASYKAKTRSVKVVVDGAKSNSAIWIRQQQDVINADNYTQAHLDSCTANADTCYFQVPVDYHMSFEHKARGNDRFEHWTVIDEVTRRVLQDTANYRTYDLTVETDYIVVGHFGEKDEHCFYADFDSTHIWCDGSSDDCIDQCQRYYDKTISNFKQDSCLTRGGQTDDLGTQSSSYWLVPRSNNGQGFAKPTISTQDHFLYYDNDKNSSSGNASITYLLNRAQAGGHGLMSTSFKTCVLQQKNQAMNSGFILRSSKATGEYSIVQIFLDARDNKKSSGPFPLVARVCKGDGSGIKNDKGCLYKTFPNVSLSDTATVISADIDLPKGSNEATVKIKFSQGGSLRESSVKINVAATSLTREDTYVGISFAEQCFKVKNVLWNTYDWDTGCTDADMPQLGCSFASNYLAGTLPLGEEVTPWVGTSSWFTDPENPYKMKDACQLSYHYNGCDIDPDASTFACSEWNGARHCSRCSDDSDGPFYVTGAAAQQIRNGQYVFTRSGVHGSITKTYEQGTASYTGTVRDASIVVNCGDEGIFTKSCGGFNVGSISQCAQSISYRLSGCNNTQKCVVNVVGGYANLRASSLVGELSGLLESETNPPIVNFVLKDSEGNSSQQMQVSTNGRFWRDVNLYADMPGFDPERVASIVIEGTQYFTLSSLYSDCSNAIDVSECTAQFDHNYIVIGSKMINPENAECEVYSETSAYGVAQKGCPTNGRFKIEAGELTSELNASGDLERDYRFIVKMISKENSELVQTCTTSVMTVNNNAMDCYFKAGAEKVLPGEDLPPIYFNVTNCPSGNCNVKASLNEGSTTDIPYKEGEEGTWNPFGLQAVAGQSYIYHLAYNGSTCNKTLVVANPSSGSLANNCRISNGAFMADLNLTQTSSVEVVHFDNIGVPVTIIKKPAVGATTEEFNEPLPTNLGPGTYTLALMVNQQLVCLGGEYTVGSAATLPDDLQCSITGDGRFVTGVANNTGSPIDVKLMCGAKGSSEASEVATSVWYPGYKIDEDANVENLRNSSSNCEEFRLVVGSEVACSVDMPEGSGSGDEPVTEVKAECGVFAIGSNDAITQGVAGEEYTFKVFDIAGASSETSLTVEGFDSPETITSTSEFTRTFTTPNNSGSATYKVKNGTEVLCSRTFTWTTLSSSSSSSESSSSSAPKPTATCGFYEKNGTSPINSGSSKKSYYFQASISTDENLIVECDGSYVNNGGQSSNVKFTPEGNKKSFNASNNTKGSVTCTASYKISDNSIEQLCKETFTWQ